ncbi:hypothetical protein [Nocardia canadensis]|uniref:hypothetical protein n=1 Tax=Nocardia canadensis TaxID=3065238 RepID=UPI00292DCF6B|nr:hypothetical protein [Nocardia canadensis]
MHQHLSIFATDQEQGRCRDSGQPCVCQIRASAPDDHGADSAVRFGGSPQGRWRVGAEAEVADRKIAAERRPQPTPGAGQSAAEEADIENSVGIVLFVRRQQVDAHGGESVLARA